jgi:hypothetical protein
MEWIFFAALLVGTAVAILVLAGRAARPDAEQRAEADDPHAGLLREVAGQEGPRIWDP